MRNEASTPPFHSRLENSSLVVQLVIQLQGLGLRAWGGSGVFRVPGHLAHKKTHPPRTLP